MFFGLLTIYTIMSRIVETWGHIIEIARGGFEPPTSGL